MMLVIGVTGCMGCGKTSILRYLEENCNCRVIRTDETAKDLERPGKVCYRRILKLFPDPSAVLNDDGTLDNAALAARIFADETLRGKVNAIVHPEVEKYVRREIEKERRADRLSYLFIEAAMLIEAGYLPILDRLWYVYAPRAVRAERLKESRGYSDEKIRQIMRRQLSDRAFRAHADAVIDNGGTHEETARRIDRLLIRETDSSCLS